jgi:hypothetical protein
MQTNFKKLFNQHFEWAAFTVGLLLLGLMNPYVDQGTSWCLFEWMGISFCPGEGLGHSIAFIFRGDLNNAMQANMIGPFALAILLSRIGYLINQIFKPNQFKNI